MTFFLAGYRLQSRDSLVIPRYSGGQLGFLNKLILEYSKIFCQALNEVKPEDIQNIQKETISDIANKSLISIDSNCILDKIEYGCFSGGKFPGTLPHTMKRRGNIEAISLAPLSSPELVEEKEGQSVVPPFTDRAS